MKKLLLALVALIAGCATQDTMNVPGIERSASVQIKDLRPGTEKEKGLFSLSIFNDAYGIFRVPDSEITPSASRLLQHRAFEKFGADGKPLEIKLRHLVIYRNQQAEFRRAAVGNALAGFAGTMIAGRITMDPTGNASSLIDGRTFESLAASEYKRALYTEKENPVGGSVFVIYIQTEIRGKSVFTRTVAPARNTDGEKRLPAALEASIRFHLAQYL